MNLFKQIIDELGEEALVEWDRHNVDLNIPTDRLIAHHEFCVLPLKWTRSKRLVQLEDCAAAKADAWCVYRGGRFVAVWTGTEWMIRGFDPFEETDKFERRVAAKML